MKTSLRQIAVAVAVGAIAWFVGTHGRASDDPKQRANPPSAKTQPPIDHFPRGSTQSRYEVIHVVVPSAKSYDGLRADFESIVKRAEFDIFGDLPAEEINRKLTTMRDKDGVLILAQSEVGRRQTLLVGHPVRAKHYLVGNPLIAARMIGRHTGTALYVPLRVLVYEDARGRAVIAYDQPSSLLGQFQDQQVLEVARMLDRKLAEIATKAAE